MKTINLRLLVEDDEDAEALAEELRIAAQTNTPSVTLWGFVCRVELVESTADDAKTGSPGAAHRSRRQRDDYPFLGG